MNVKIRRHQHTRVHLYKRERLSVAVCGPHALIINCGTPELWRDAAGLCARVRACAGASATESLPTYMRYIHSIT